jgi:hypothetical protein
MNDGAPVGNGWPYPVPWRSRCSQRETPRRCPLRLCPSASGQYSRMPTRLQIQHSNAAGRPIDVTGSKRARLDRRMYRRPARSPCRAAVYRLPLLWTIIFLKLARAFVCSIFFRRWANLVAGLRADGFCCCAITRYSLTRVALWGADQASANSSTMVAKNNAETT